MKKLFTATLAIAMGATCIGALAACNTGNDAETAEKAIKAIRTMYIESAKETPVDYEVIGQVKIDDNMYSVDWSVSPAENCAVNDISDYVSVGEMGENKKVTIGISQATVDVDYVLTASVTVGKASDSVDFKHVIPAKLGEVSVESAISVSKAISLASGLENGKYYQEDGVDKQVYVVGYVTDTGVVEDTRIKNVKIADSVDSTETINIGSLNYNDVFTKGSTLNKGDKITVKAYVEKFNDAVSLYANSEGKNYPEVAKIERIAQDDDQIVAAAKEAVNLQGVFVKGEVDLLGKYNDANLSWAVSGTSTAVSVADNKLTINDVAADTTVTLTVTITKGDASDTKNIDIKVIPATTKGTQENPYTAAEVIAIAKTLSKNAYYYVNNAPQAVYVQGYVTVAGTWNAENSRYQNVYIADVAGAEKADSLCVYTVTAQEGTALTQEGDIALNDRITFCGYIQYYNGSTPEITYNGQNVVTAVAKAEDTRTPEQKVADALTAFENAYSGKTITGNVSLKSTVNGVNLTIESSSNQTVIAPDGTVTRPEADTQVTLTVKATCGDKDDTKTVTVTVKAALNLTGDGTLNNPYSVADVKEELLKDIASGSYYGGNDAPTLVHVKGYVIISGSWSSKNNNYTGVYIVDEYGANKTAGSDDAIQIYGLVSGIEGLTIDADHPVPKGTLITVTGYLQNYSTGKQITYKSGTNPTVVKTEGISDAVKVANALAEVGTELDNITEAGEYMLPNVDGVTLAWAITEGSEVAQLSQDGTKLVVNTLPAANTPVKLTLTATCGDVTKTQQVTVTVNKEGNGGENQGTPVNLDVVGQYSTYTSTGWTNSYADHTVSFSDLGVSDFSGTVTIENSNKQNSGNAIDDRPVINIKNATRYVTVDLTTADKCITEVTFELSKWSSDAGYTEIYIQYWDGTEWKDVGKNVNTPGTHTATGLEGVTKVRLVCKAGNSNARAGLGAITLKVASTTPTEGTEA